MCARPTANIFSSSDNSVKYAGNHVGLRHRVVVEGSQYQMTGVRRLSSMAVRIEKDGPVWTVIHDRPEARNAMDPKSADALTTAFLEFDSDKDASVAVFYGAGGAFCAGWDLKYVSTLDADYPLGNSISPLHGHVAMAAKFRADRWGLLGSSWTSRSLQRSRALPSLAVWNWGYGAISE